MGIRYYISDLVAPDGVADYTRLAVADSGVAYVACLADGLTWGLAYCVSTDWTACDADSRNFRLFSDFDDTATRDELVDRLRTTTVAQVPLVRRTAVVAKLTALGISTVGITGTMTILEVLRRIGTSTGLQFDEGRLSVMNPL